MTAPSVGLVGCGRWGRNILRDLRQLGCRVAVATLSDDSAAVARAGGAAEVVRGAGALPAGLDGIVVATPTSTHADIVLSLLGTGVPLFVEKPLTPDLEKARRIAKEGAGRVFVMHKWRYHPGIEALAQIARGGEFGRVLGIRTFRLGWGTPHADVDAVWILLPHDLSILLHILGAVPAPRAASWDPLGRPGDGLIGILEDGGVRAVVEVSACHPEQRRSVVLACEEASVQLTDSYAESLVIQPHGAGKVQHRGIEGALPLHRELDAFVAHLRGGPPPMTGVADELAVLEAIVSLRALAESLHH